MRGSTLLAVKGAVEATMLLGEPVSGWEWELAKCDPLNPPEGSIDDFRAALPDTVPEFVDYEPVKRLSWLRWWLRW